MKLHSMPTLPAILALSLEVAGRPMFATGADLGARAAETTTLPPSPTAAPVMPFRRADDDNYEAPKTIGTYTLTGTDYTTNADGLLVVGLEEASEIVEAGKTLSSASAIEAVSVSRTTRTVVATYRVGGGCTGGYAVSSATDAVDALCRLSDAEVSEGAE